jgi:iron complex outermembrane recepter protein
VPLLVAAIHAQAPCEITGTVRDATGAVLQAATVTVRGAADRATKTGPDGRFDFQNLPDGEYDLTATRDGFAPEHRRLRIDSGGTALLEVTLSVQFLEETLVTAEKTGERDVQAMPMAVSVLSGSELQRQQAHTVEDIAGRAPSVTFSQNTGFSQLTIRGIGTNVVFAGSDPSSAVYVDGVYVARPAMVLADFLDLQRVEVLRGPQGTLYGRNAVGGALNLITQAPTNDTELSARFVVGSLGEYRGEGRVSGAIIRDKVLASVAFLRGVRDGFVRDLDHLDHLLGGEDVTAARGKVRFVFNRRTDLLVSGDVTHQDPTPLTYAKVLAVKPGFQIDNPPDSREVRTSTPAESRNLQYGTSGRLSVNLAPDVVLTSLTAFRKTDYDVLVDADITELELTVTRIHEKHWQVSEELTVARQGPRLTWIGGLFLFDDADSQRSNLLLGAARLQSRLDPDVDSNSRALFGEATVGIAPRVSAIAGLRYTRENKSIANQGGLYPYDTPDVPSPGSAYAYSDDMTHTAWTPKAGLEVRVGTDSLVYGSATRGFKSGGFNPTSQSAGLGYAPEWAWSYEGGLKTAVAHGRARLNVAAFQTDYTDLQVQTTIRPGVIDISNAAEATIRGVELEGSARVAAPLKLGGHVAWLDATYDRYLAVGVGGVTSDAAGHRLSNAPEWSGRLWLEWSPSIGGADVLSLRAESKWQSTVFFTPINDTIQRQQSYALLDISAELQPKSWWCAIGGFVRNVTGEDYITGTFGSPPPAIGGRPGEPRQAGVQITVRR